MTYKCDTIADSVGPHGHRITTFEVTFPRPYLAEFNTHRMLSRNSESSRAIPTELQLARVDSDPYIPEFRKRVKGMGGGDFLEGEELDHATSQWRMAADCAVMSAKMFLDVSKDDANRLLEPFMWHTVIVTATEWDNFLNLRDHPDAALPMQHVAKMIRKGLDESTPRHLEYGEWHTPFVPTPPSDQLTTGGLFNLAQVSAGICARSSYSTHHNPESADESKRRWDRLAHSGHWSPAEHPAQCIDVGPYAEKRDTANFKGFLQLRKMYPNESTFQRHDQ